MRGFSIYLAMGILVVLALDFIAPPVGLGFDVIAWPVVERGSIVQFVDRSNKGDRLPAPTATGKQLMPKKPPTILIGCDPAFSPLTAAAHANLPARCIATRISPQALVG
jgi:hypothetical protein